MDMVLLEAKGIEIAHVIVSCSIVYRASQETHYNYVSGDSEMLTPEQMDKILEDDRENLKEEGVEDLDDYFEQYYEVSYRGQTKKYSVQEYNSLVDMFEVMNQNMIAAIFMY